MESPLALLMILLLLSGLCVDASSPPLGPQGPVTLARLRLQVDTEQPPLFRFARDMNQVIESEVFAEESSLVDCQMIFDDYIGKLRDYYVEAFSKEVCDMSPNTVPELIASRRAFYIRECDVAMRAALPRHTSCKNWKFDGALAELQEDLDQVVLAHDIGSSMRSPVVSNEELALDMPYKKRRSLPRPVSRLVGAIRKVWKKNKRVRWVASQALLLLVNFCQSEWHRRQSLNAAEKRLADVPEFPLL